MQRIYYFPRNRILSTLVILFPDYRHIFRAAVYAEFCTRRKVDRGVDEEIIPKAKDRPANGNAPL